MLSLTSCDNEPEKLVIDEVSHQANWDNTTHSWTGPAALALQGISLPLDAGND